MTQQKLFKHSNPYEQLNPNDVVFTPDDVAKLVVEYFKPSGMCLDPCMGEGAFYKYLPKNSRDWCEIVKGKDFFEYHTQVDWIVTNPPYSNFNEFLAHACEISDNIVFLTPQSKFFKSWGTLMQIFGYGGFKTILFMKARKCGFPFGFPVACTHIVRDYKGLTKVDYIT